MKIFGKLMEENKRDLVDAGVTSHGCNGKAQSCHRGDGYAMGDNTTRCFMFCTHTYAWKKGRKTKHKSKHVR